MKNRTTMQVTKELKEELKKAKKYSRETYEDTIKRLLLMKRELRKR